ncbi:ATP-binding protein [bacterium]|nr:ATP-binding protein [bacterium]
MYAQFGLRDGDFPKHVLIVGMTGTGKTNLAFQLLRQQKRHKKPFLVFDWKKSYRRLKSLPEFKDLEVIRIGDEKSKFKFNPLIPPPGVHPKHWMTLLIDVIKHAFFVGHGVEYFFRRGIDELYSRNGVYEDNDYYPTFKDLENLLKKEHTKGREILWMSAAKRVLSILTFSGLIGDVLNVNMHRGIDELLKKDVVIELDNLASAEKVFLIESILLWIYQYRKQQGKREEFQHSIILEEAHHILSSAKELSSGEETVVESMIRMVREFGESIVVIDQEPSKLSNSILANTNCKICFTLGNGKDIFTISSAMNLTEDQKRFIDLQKIGCCMVKMKDRFNEPVYCQVPYIELKGESAIGIP